MATERPEFPNHEFPTDDPDHRAALDAFQSEYGRETPDEKRLREHAERVRGVPALLGPFERWWMDPKVQAFIAELGATGI